MYLRKFKIYGPIQRTVDFGEPNLTEMEARCQPSIEY